MTASRAASHRRGLALLGAAVLALLFLPHTAAPARGAPPPPPGSATGASAAVEEVTGFGSNPGALRMFRHVPDGLPGGRPVVVALHGCTQNATGYGTSSGWTELADRWGFSVVLPGQTAANNLNSCFNWFRPADIGRGAGEAASIAQTVDRQLADTGADAGRVHVTGLSAGGGMAAVMLAAYPDKFRAGGVVAGLPYGCAQAAGSPFVCMYVGASQTPGQWGDRVRAAAGSHDGPWPRLAVLHGTADRTVVPANMTALVAQWTDLHGTDREPDVSDTVAGHPHRVYENAAGEPVAETYEITGMGHGQPVDPGTGPEQCGTAGAYSLDAGLCAAHRLGTLWGLG
ncbi:PHB depolymerase family esterase [Streptomyces sp. NPDC048845]|uniref:extracellular catalytic domain type 1 short-chain-length polyhydroxyalkanoate depolymerase n=1 Tax=Streptomyces sp. NPDC048845 TaxID=3155390 RepID=UPI00342875F0